MQRRARLIIYEGKSTEEAYPFTEQIVIGRKRPPALATEGYVRVRDPAVSGRHCVVRQADDGRFFVRDESRNGTRLDSRRLLPNVETEIRDGAVIEVGGNKFRLTLKVDTDVEPARDEDLEDEGTQALINTETEVTVLVGDITGYTAINQKFKSADVYESVGRVFAELEKVVVEHDGAIKEYQGDAIFAYWERDDADPMWHSRQACHAALALRDRLTELAKDSSIWAIGTPLAMDWALTTGDVLISTIGGDRPVGLAMVGDAVNYAFRLEKLAGDENGKILICKTTRETVEDHFALRDIGLRKVKGRESAELIFSLEKALVSRSRTLCITRPELAVSEQDPIDDEALV